MVRSRRGPALGTGFVLTFVGSLCASCASPDSDGGNHASPAGAPAPSDPSTGSGGGGSHAAAAGSDAAREGANVLDPDDPPALDAAQPPEPLDAAVGGADSATPPLEDAGPIIPERTGLPGKLCDRQPGITFAAVIGPGTELQGYGSSFMTENGTLFLAVEGNCRFWVQPGRFDPAFTGILGDEQLERLIELFQLETWQGSVSATTGGAGTPNTWLIFGRVDPRPACGPALPNTECSEPPWRTSAGIVHNTALQGLRLAIDELRTVGTPVDGDVRYLLTAGQWALPSHHWARPGVWPLDDPDDHVFPQPGQDDGYRPGLSRLAQDGDARALRALWQQLLAYEITGREPDQSPRSAAAMPIEHGGMRYELFVRDALPIEDELGRIAF